MTVRIEYSPQTNKCRPHQRNRNTYGVCAMNQTLQRRTLLSALVYLPLILGIAVSTNAGEVKQSGRTFKVPDGFTIERVAGPPLVDRPISAAFDGAGRLYVSDSSGSNDNVKKQLAEKPHRIVRLEDTNNDGTFDKQVVFADKMMFPEGTMWLAGSLYVAAPPSIWKLTDTNDDGVADKRVEWFAGKTLTGCANDLHGPYLGLDGWIYWCKGAFAEQTYERPGKPPFVTKAAHIFRARPDGSGIEPVMTGGMDNPVDVAFTPGGERIFTTTFFVHPGGGQRDGLVHAIYGGIYGKVHDPIFQPAHKWTGPEVMPVLLHMGPAAPCGLVRYESDDLGKSFQDNLFACYFNLHKVSRHVLIPQGATFTTKDEDFVTSPDLDFHPTDILEDADGSLLVVDTGGWYKLCCPTSQLHKPDVLGGIYRVRRTDRVKRPGDAAGFDPWGHLLFQRQEDFLTAMPFDDYVKLLGSTRLAWRRHVMEDLSRPGREKYVLPTLREVSEAEKSPVLHRNIIWTLARMNDANARAQVQRFLWNPDETVRQAAIHAAALWRDRGATYRLIELLKDSPPHNRRAAAEALGRIGAKEAVPALLEAASQPVDRILEHSITYALIEIADPKATAAGLQSKSLRTIRTAMVALDQMEGGGLNPTFVAGLLAATDPALKETASWLVGRHPDWAAALAGVLRHRLDKTDLPAADRAELERQLGRFAQASPIQQLLAARLNDAAASHAARQSCLQAMAQSGLREKEVPASWVAELATVLGDEHPDAQLVALAVAAVRALPFTRTNAGNLPEKLLRLGAQTKNPGDLRLSALAAVPGGLSKPDSALFEFLLSKLGREQPVASRTTAADVLARAQLTHEQLLHLADVLGAAGPVEVDRLLGAFEQSTDEALGLKLLGALAESPAFSSLRIDALKAHLAKYGPAVQKRAESLYARLNVDAAKQKSHLEQLMTTLSAGDVRRGQLTFHSEKAACFACHAIGYRGGNVGPDLTRIGSIRSDRDLLEAIVYPSASLVRSFEPIAVATNEGKVYNGLLRGENADELVLATGVNQESRVPRSQIEEIRPSTVSIMPAGLDQQLTPQELADLVAFLKACK
jgi:putative membrane-bound dehydrogenase-like protein